MNSRQRAIELISSNDKLQDHQDLAMSGTWAGESFSGANPQPALDNRRGGSA
ncbi:MAG TPA: hypothetical protein VHU42_05815 [Rhodopila sp.]|jgi:hypothetical protein|nr:hypothetical protein [Rhodopila sp.]